MVDREETGAGMRLRKHPMFWIRGSIKRRGALRRKLHAKPGRPIPLGRERRAAKRKGLIGYEAREALTLRRISQRRRRRK